MATKTTKSSRKTSARKVRDLPARKNPKGGAQKKEGQTSGMKRAGSSGFRANKTQLA